MQSTWHSERLAILFSSVQPWSLFRHLGHRQWPVFASLLNENFSHLDLLVKRPRTSSTISDLHLNFILILGCLHFNANVLGPIAIKSLTSNQVAKTKNHYLRLTYPIINQYHRIPIRARLYLNQPKSSQTLH